MLTLETTNIRLPDRIKDIIDQETIKAINESIGIKYICDMNTVVGTLERYHISDKTLDKVMIEIIEVNREFSRDPDIKYLPRIMGPDMTERFKLCIFNYLDHRYTRVPDGLRGNHPDLDIELDREGYVCAECANIIIRRRIAAMDKRIRERRGEEMSSNE